MDLSTSLLVNAVALTATVAATLIVIYGAFELVAAAWRCYSDRCWKKYMAEVEAEAEMALGITWSPEMEEEYKRVMNL